MSDNETELYRPVPLDSVHHDSSHSVEITATREECAALASRFNCISISHLTGCFDLMFHTRNDDQNVEIVNIIGKLNANVVQECVVTSEAVEATIQVRFGGILAATATEHFSDIIDDDDGGDDDVPEILGLIVDETVDLGSILAEQLALELDPFPRKPGSSFDEYGTANMSHAEDELPNPFAVLAKLKDNPE